MGKLPAFQFYPGDWIQDTRPISLSAKGAWIDLLCAMWHSQTRGRLSLPMIGYARLLGASVEQTEVVIAELIDMQICDNETGCNGNVTLVNRRMEREEKQRIQGRCRVKRFRNADEKRTCNDDVTHASSSSSSIKKEKKERNTPVTIPEWLEEKDWQDFKEHRTKLRKPMTPRAEEILIAKLTHLKEQGHNPRHLLITAIERGWQSVFTPKEDGV